MAPRYAMHGKPLEGFFVRSKQGTWRQGARRGRTESRHARRRPRRSADDRRLRAASDRGDREGRRHHRRRWCASSNRMEGAREALAKYPSCRYSRSRISALTAQGMSTKLLHHAIGSNPADVMPLAIASWNFPVITWPQVCAAAYRFLEGAAISGSTAIDVIRLGVGDFRPRKCFAAQQIDCRTCQRAP